METTEFLVGTAFVFALRSLERDCRDAALRRRYTELIEQIRNSHPEARGADHATAVGTDLQRREGFPSWLVPIKVSELLVQLRAMEFDGSLAALSAESDPKQLAKSIGQLIAWAALVSIRHYTPGNSALVSGWGTIGSSSFGVALEGTSEDDVYREVCETLREVANARSID